MERVGAEAHAANGYHILSGTSMATPIVTGVAALILGKFTQLSPIILKERILTHCDEVAVFLVNVFRVVD